MEKQGLSLKEAQAVVGVSYPTILALAHQKGFPAFKVGKRWIVPKEPLLDWLTEQAELGKTLAAK